MKAQLKLLQFILLSFILCNNCVNPSSKGEKDNTKNKIFKGINLVSPSQPVQANILDSIVGLNANYVSIIPYGFVNRNDSIVKFNIDWQWWGEKDEGVIKMVEYAKSKNLKTMLKPQIWLHEQYTGTYNFTTENQWVVFENSFKEFTLHFAKLAQKTNCESYCIGTEWENFIVKRPKFWKALIQDIKKIYKGELTYASNWDSYQKFPFWKELDYIGINAYFPISESQTPTKEECILGWQIHYNAIKNFQSKTQKPVIFTEYGYRSMDYTGQKPWDSEHKTIVNLAAQTNAYQAIYNVFWKEKWFEGGFFWKWHLDHNNIDGEKNNRFTPQNKPAQEIIRANYSK